MTMDDQHQKATMVKFAEDKENEKKRMDFRKTPHPNKGTVTLDDDENPKTQLFDEPASKKAKTNNHISNNLDDETNPTDSDDAVEMEVENEDDAAAWLEQWETVCDELLKETSKYKDSLVMFLDCVKNRESAQEKVENLYSVTRTVCEQSLDSILRASVPVHEHLGKKMTSMEKDLLECFGNNHEARIIIYKKLEAYHSEYERNSANFVARLKKQEIASVEMTTQAESDDTEDGTETIGPKSDTTGEDDVDGAPDPDWETIIELDPSSSEAVQLFLDARETWAAASDSFSIALDEVHEQLKAIHTNILSVVEEAFHSIAEQGEEQQFDIQQNIMNNHIRRKEFKDAVEKKEKVFAKLKACISGGAFVFGTKEKK